MLPHELSSPPVRLLLTGANLTKADLTEADLTEADLAEADLSGADLSGVDLTGAMLSGTKPACMYGEVITIRMRANARRTTRLRSSGNSPSRSCPPL